MDIDEGCSPNDFSSYAEYLERSGYSIPDRPFRLLVCGSRDWQDRATIARVLKDLPQNTIIIEGEARGADTIAREEAEKLGYKVERYPADWKRYGPNMSESVTRGKVLNTCSKIGFGTFFTLISPLLTVLILKLVGEVSSLGGGGTSLLKAV